MVAVVGVLQPPCGDIFAILPSAAAAAAIAAKLTPDGVAVGDTFVELVNTQLVAVDVDVIDCETPLATAAADA